MHVNIEKDIKNHEVSTALGLIQFLRVNYTIKISQPTGKFSQLTQTSRLTWQLYLE